MQDRFSSNLFLSPKYSMIIENFILLPSSWHPPIALTTSNLDECIQVMVVHYAAKKTLPKSPFPL